MIFALGKQLEVPYEKIAHNHRNTAMNLKRWDDSGVWNLVNITEWRRTRRTCF